MQEVAMKMQLVVKLIKSLNASSVIGRAHTLLLKIPDTALLLEEVEVAAVVAEVAVAVMEEIIILLQIRVLLQYTIIILMV